MAAGRIRNRGCVPYLDGEGKFLKPLIPVPPEKDSCRKTTKSPFHRMYMHHTLASARRFAYFKRYENIIPNDELDFVLSSTYDQTTDSFPNKYDSFIQPETKEDTTSRKRFRNTRDLTPDREQIATKRQIAQEEIVKGVAGVRKRKVPPIPYRYNSHHKLLIGGITELIHPSSVKLINSSHHLPQTNPGYSRQPSDGNVYQY